MIKRYAGNPILSAKDIPFEVTTVHNAAVTKVDDRYVMLYRAHLRTGRSVIGLAESRDGFKFESASEPFISPAADGHFGPYEEFGVEDPRISKIDGSYYITYSAYSRHGVRMALAKTTDFTNLERLAFITTADHRNVVLFPEKIDGRYIRLERPHTDITPWSIWVSYSPDLIHWGDAKRIIAPTQYHWDELKIGPGAPPIRTEAGWLNIYHGVFQTMDGAVYRLGVALHDLEDPARVIGVADEWILQPEDPWELTGYVHNVVFCCGAVPEDDGTLKVYWGGTDSVMCVGTAVVQDLVELCQSRSRPAI